MSNITKQGYVYIARGSNLTSDLSTIKVKIEGDHRAPEVVAYLFFLIIL